MAHQSTKSVIFAGASEYVDLGNVHTFTRTTPFSVSFWFKTSSPGNMVFISKLMAAPQYTGWEVYFDTSEEITFHLLNDAGLGNYLSVKARDWSVGALNDNQWHHVVVTWDGDVAGGALGVEIYVDAVNARTHGDIIVNFNNLTLPDTTSTADLNFARRPDATNYYVGNLDDISIWDRVLTQAEVYDIWNNNEPNVVAGLTPSPGLVGWWKMGDMDTHPTLQDWQTQIATTTGAGVLDRSQNSNNGTPTNMENADFSDKILISQKMPDLSGNGYVGTLVNIDSGDIITDTPGGRSRISIYLNQATLDEYVTMGDVTSFNYNTPFSAVFWFKTLNTDSGRNAFGKKDGPGGDYRGWMINHTNGQFTFALTNSSGSTIWSGIQTNSSYNDGVWHCLVATYSAVTPGSASDMIIYMDGSVAATSVLSDTLLSLIHI